jgi:uncharacterized membrane protein YkoI
LAPIPLEQAKAAAPKTNPGTSMIKVELDNKDGELVCGVTLSNGADVKVDAEHAAVSYTDSNGGYEG